MASFVLRRIASTIPVMVVVAVVVFFLLRLAPGDPAAVIAGDGASIEQVEKVRVMLGLDRSILEQFIQWGGQVLQGDLGTSIFTKKPVTELIAQRIEPTLSLTVLTTLISAILGIGLGTLAAARAGTWLDNALILLAVAGFSVPVFVVGYALVFVFAIRLGWFPVQGYSRIADGFGTYLNHIILPSLTLSFIYIALISRITRASVIDILAQDYIRTAYAKGFGDVQVFTGHVLRNAAVPITTVIGIGVALMIGGVVVTESVFNIPGMGRLVVDAIGRRDYPVIQGVTLVFAGAYVFINMVVDLCCGIFDPRVRI
jgi:peptide/nickel transport system permease protein